ncbi:unnamed protein product [Ilex paraguariensis]|uniref:Uncharacterized protein n=1 Tax=Ilex paraguariensis TaxID=185542 RepID=A0ABC8TVP7_9AQUA
MSPQLSIDINNELASLSPTPFEPYIFRVDGLLHRENELACEPEILAIGPYHHGKANLEMMEKHKLRYLQMYLARTNESSVDTFVNAMQDLEEKTRKCYAESIGIEKDAFVRMMLLDECFIIEFFYKLAYEEVIDDPIFKSQSTQLREAGVKFKKAIETSSLLDIEFENGIMKIPPLSIDDSTEVIFRNLVANEQYNDLNEPAYVTDYRKFLDCLINSPKDVEILRHCGIIDNWLGDDEAVSSLLNRLSNKVILDSTSFCYSEIFNKINDHCKHRRYKWMTKLRHNYFNNPWSIISLFGATLLLVLIII